MVGFQLAQYLTPIFQDAASERRTLGLYKTTVNSLNLKCAPKTPVWILEAVETIWGGAETGAWLGEVRTGDGTLMAIPPSGPGLISFLFCVMWTSVTTHSPSRAFLTMMDWNLPESVSKNTPLNLSSSVNKKLILSWRKFWPLSTLRNITLSQVSILLNYWNL